MRILENIEPKNVFYRFEDISRIPRGSGNEKAVADYIENFAKSLSLFVYRDSENNVFVKKEASPNLEGRPAVLLQAHTDMVCEKDSNKEHDFTKDAIELILDRENGIIRADSTTLGADDGIGVALMLALLEDKELRLPPIECLFTTGEETGLCGMKAFDTSLISARCCINLDSEDDSSAVVSCAGGVRSDFEFNDIPLEKCKNEITLEVTGLCGGHSGADIHLGRANAVKTAFALLGGIENARLISADGGNKDNAIPRECRILFTCDDPVAACETIKDAADNLRSELTDDDKGFECRVSYRRGEFYAFAEKYSRAVITLVNSLPCGVIEMSSDLEGLVETSSNLGVIRTGRSSVMITVSSRSSVESSLDALTDSLNSLASFVKASKITHRDRYPGWEFTKDSKLQKIYKETYKELFGAEPKIYAIHAGLECGILKKGAPHLDIISTGPNALNIHTPSESLSVKSVEKIYTLLVKLLTDSDI